MSSLTAFVAADAFSGGAVMGDGVQSKIFGIGLSKTGTSSLAQALQRLGFRTKDCMGARSYLPGDLSSLDMDTVLAHDALTDTPIPSFYRELDARFPGSKFILTVREREGWLQSCRKQFNERSAAAQSDAHRRLFEDLYGTNVFDEERFAAGYDRFVAGVLEHFKQRPGDLLVLDVTAGDGWDELCPFLGCPVPDMPFPKANVTQIRWMNIEDLASIAEAAGRELMVHYSGAIAPEIQGRGPGASSVPRRLLQRALHMVGGIDATKVAMRACIKVIMAGLQKRSPGIPVLSPLDEVPAYRERKRWNHVWLVEPLDGAQAYAEGRDDFTVNLALVEDGVPIYGVVHAPAKGLTYFGRTGKGAFKRSSGGAAVRLAGGSRHADATDASAVVSGMGVGGCSHSLAICAQLELAGDTGMALPATTECRAAAGQAMLNASGQFCLVDHAGTECTYNKQELTIGSQRIRERVPA